MAWVVSQHLESLVGPSISTFIKLLFDPITISIAWVFIFSLRGLPVDEREAIQSAFVYGLIPMVFSMVGGIREMIFHISETCLFWSFGLALCYLRDDNNDDEIPPDKVLRLMDGSKRSDYDTKMGFRFQLVCTHLVSHAILCLLAIVYPRLFEECVILVAISIAFCALLISSHLYELDMIYLTAQDALRVDSISNETIEELECIYPEGFDTDRFQYLLHDTLREDPSGEYISLSEIQMLINIFPSGIMKVEDDEGATPFQVACLYYSVGVVEYLLGTEYRLLDTRDNRGDTALHYACRGNNYKVVKYLLERRMQLVNKRNAEGDLPVYLLCSTGENSSNRDDPEHVETIWRLLLAYPEDMS